MIHKGKMRLRNNVITKENFITTKRGEIWICNLGTNNIGSEENKIRPCLIIQNNDGNRHAPTTIVCPISHKKKGLPTHVKIKRFTNYTVTGISMAEQIRTISKRRLIRKVGELPEEIMATIDESLKISLAL